jgi:hypothetical protein
MQTFLPVPDFYESAKILDYRRLGKQRLEAKQLIDCLQGDSIGWVNHPACKMWEGYIPALKEYLRIVIFEWIQRGYKNTMIMPDINKEAPLPYWMGNSVFHDSHKSNLLRKDFAHYSKYNWYVEDNLPYFWPKSQFAK